MYRECVKCRKLGTTCAGPNFMALPASELLAWCKARKEFMRMSNAELARLSGMPKGTVDGLLTGDRIDFRYESIRPMLRILVGGEWRGKPCVDARREEEAQLRRTIEQLERDSAATAKSLAETKEEDESRINYFKEQLKISQEISRRKSNAIIVLGVVLGLVLLILIVALATDMLDPDMGFLWREKIN